MPAGRFGSNRVNDLHGTGRVGAEVEYINFDTATGIGVISGEEAESFDFGLAVTGGTGIGILGFGALGLMLVRLGVGLTLRQRAEG